MQLNIATNTVHFNYALLFFEESRVLECIRIHFGYVWTGKFDLNTLRADGNIFLAVIILISRNHIHVSSAKEKDPISLESIIQK